MPSLRNPVLMLAWGLPLVAVLASFLTLGLVMLHPDGELPEQYHWEGFQLDRDFSRGERAAELGIDASLTGFGRSGTCQLELSMTGSPPGTLTLLLAHATRPELDRHVALHRVQVDAGNGARALYAGECQSAPAGHWRLELVDAANDWAVRRSVRGSLERVTLAVGVAQDD